MKKILASLLLLSVAVGYADGQTALTGNKFADNWAIGVNAGGTTPLMHHSFFKNMRPVVGVHVDKYLTPTFGLSLEAMGSFNTTGSKTAFDASNVSLLGLVNLGNLFAGYNGAPRLFEVEIQSQFAGHTVTVFAHTGVYVIMQPADTCQSIAGCQPESFRLGK